MTVRAIVASFALLTAAGCSSSSPLPGVGPASTSTTASVYVAPPVDPNVAVCASVQDYMAGAIKASFNRWKPTQNEYDPRLAREVRVEATHLYALQGRARGVVSDAIGAEAKGLTDLSIAVEGRDDAGVIAGANAANSEIAHIRGVCGF